jgi:hypothetical protein
MEKCTKPKRKGGLGIINLKTQNYSLLIKHLDKFYNRKDIPWVKLIWSTHYSNGDVPHIAKDIGSFWRRDVLKLVDQFRGIASCKIGDGKTVLFRSDVWNGHMLQQQFPRLYSFAKNKSIFVAQFLQSNQLECQFHLPLPEQAYQEYQHLQQLILQLQVEENTKDTCNTFGVIPHIHDQSFIICYIKVFTPQNHFYGYGTPTVLTKSRSSPDFCLWID